PIAVVVAETLEQAIDGAATVRVRYDAAPAALDFDAAKARAHSPGKVLESDADSRRGDLAAGLAAAAQRVDAVYTTPLQHHNPMEAHATLASWQGERLTLHDSSQYV